jgi:Phage protein Gp138 N-terminal domain
VDDGTGVYVMTTSKTLSDVFARAISAARNSTRVALPGSIESFDATTQLATVQPLVSDAYEGDDGKLVYVTLPVVVDVPVHFAGGGAYSTTYPVARGDSCLLLFADRDIDAWLSNGGAASPLSERTHDLTDALCIVGLRPRAAPLTEFDTGGVQIGATGGPRLRVTQSAVHLGVSNGAAATESAVLGTTYRASEDTFFAGMIGKLTAAGASLTAAGASLSAAGATAALPATMIPAPLAPSLAAAGVAVTAAATTLAQVASDLATFSAQSALYTSVIVKVK